MPDDLDNELNALEAHASGDGDLDSELRSLESNDRSIPSSENPGIDEQPEFARARAQEALGVSRKDPKQAAIAAMAGIYGALRNGPTPGNMAASPAGQAISGGITHGLSAGAMQLIPGGMGDFYKDVDQVSRSASPHLYDIANAGGAMMQPVAAGGGLLKNVAAQSAQGAVNAGVSALSGGASGEDALRAGAVGGAAGGLMAGLPGAIAGVGSRLAQAAKQAPAIGAGLAIGKGAYDGYEQNGLAGAADGAWDAAKGAIPAAAGVGFLGSRMAGPAMSKLSQAMSAMAGKFGGSTPAIANVAGQAVGQAFADGSAEARAQSYGYKSADAAREALRSDPQVLGAYASEFQEASQAEDPDSATSALITRLSRTDPQFRTDVLPNILKGTHASP